ncbi:choice-of-anchor D domain-containing protein [Candidatus Parabeggiatoa sp. HSG14]|uniref:choice-of-anchor D domain-containing protein n=1 Tax=Candidatus Parabeggiatoa sp. HSG14 TaxID=3055593 RepID=UPI0025A72B73|nr:choice-of-anchor D domain-containing protein [Thiotrichales bacterium HSG14]
MMFLYSLVPILLIGILFVTWRIPAKQYASPFNGQRYISLIGVLLITTIMSIQSTSVLAADWEWQNPPYQGNTINDVWGSSASDVFAVAQNGMILHNDGNNWTEMSSGITENLKAVWGSASNDVFAASEFGTIIHYDGSSWTAMDSGIFMGIHDIWGTANNDVFAVSWEGTIIHYDGNNWTQMSIGNIFTALYGIWGSSSNNVFAVGENDTILHYDGNNWTEMSIGSQMNSFVGVWGSSNSDVFVVSNMGIIFHYNGQTWTEMSIDPIMPPTFTDIWGTANNNVFVISEDGVIIHYDGQIWSSMLSDNSNRLFGIWGSAGSDVLAVGEEATILGYDGQNWTVSNGIYTELNDIWGTANNNVFVAGSGVIAHYDGNDWTSNYTAPSQIFRGIWGSAYNDIFAVGGAGRVIHYNGSQWTEMTSGVISTFFNDVWGSASNDVFAVGNKGVIAHYDGTNWTEMTSGITDELRGIWGSSANDVFATGYNGKILHYDGTNWTQMSSGISDTLYHIWGTASNDVFAVGSSGKILHYDGTSWTEMSSVSQVLKHIWGTSNNDIFAVGLNGIIAHYDGNSWTETSDNTFGQLNSVWGISSAGVTDVFAVSFSSTIIHSENTGSIPEIQVLDATTDIIDGTSSIDVGVTSLNTPVTKTFTVKNSGTGDITLSNLAIPTGFTITSNFGSTTVAPNVETTFEIQLDADAEGTPSGTLSFDNNDSDENPFNFTISGTVNATPEPEIEITEKATGSSLVNGNSNVDFGTTTIDVPVTKTFTITNVGDGELTLSNLSVESGFSIAQDVGNTTTIASQGQTSFEIQLDAQTEGTITAILSFDNNDSDENPFSFTLNGIVEIASTATNYTLAINKTGNGTGTVTASVGEGNGINCGSSCSETYSEGSTVSLTASSASGSVFAGWTGTGCTNSFAIQANMTCTATFNALPPPPTPDSRLLNISKAGSGNVISTPDYIDCGSDCVRYVNRGESITLTATPSTDTRFTGWSADCQGDSNPITLTVDSDTNCTANFEPEGIPKIEVYPQSHDFINASIGNTSTQTFFIYNMGEGAMQLGEITLVGADDFVLDDNCSNMEMTPKEIESMGVESTIGKNDSAYCQMTVTFQPQTEKAKMATLTIPSNDPDRATVKVPLKGTGCVGERQNQWWSFYPQQLDFGTEMVGNTLSQKQYVYTSTQGCGALQPDTMVITRNQADQFSIQNRHCYHGAWQNYSYSSCEFDVLFSPQSAGSKLAQLGTTFNDDTVKSAISLKGTAITNGQASIEISPSNHDFGTVTVGNRSDTQIVTLKNTGNINLNVDSIKAIGANSSDFEGYQWSWCTYQGFLKPTEQCQIYTQFVPNSLGDKLAELIITSDAPTVITVLTGTGTKPADCSEEHITIESTGDADQRWAAKTASGKYWNAYDGATNAWTRIQNLSAPNLPTANDVVRIKNGHTITGIPYTTVKALCIEEGAILESLDNQGTGINIQATDYIQNRGIIRGKNGTDEKEGAISCYPNYWSSEGCAISGAGVSLSVGDWPGGIFRNEGTIIAGNGGHGKQYGASGGWLSIWGKGLTNATHNGNGGIIRAGNGGDITGDQPGKAGQGGGLSIWGSDYLHSLENTSVYAGNGGNCNRMASQIGGDGGNMWLNANFNVELQGTVATGKGGMNCAANGKPGRFNADPSVLKLSGANVNIEGGDIAIYGGKEWILDLSKLNRIVATANGDITLAVGEGGIIDLSGNHSPIFKAAGQVNIFADRVELDNGMTLFDLIIAKDIVRSSSKILRGVTLIGSGKSVGEPEAIIPVSFTLANSGPEVDSYTFTITDSSGWTFTQLPASLELEGLAKVELVVNVTLPAIRGAMDVITVTATSQADPQVSETAEVQIAVAQENNLLPQEPTLEESNVNVPGSETLPEEVSSNDLIPTIEGTPSNTTSEIGITTSSGESSPTGSISETGINDLPGGNASLEGSPLGEMNVVVSGGETVVGNTPHQDHLSTTDDDNATVADDDFMARTVVIDFPTPAIPNCPTTGMIKKVCRNYGQVITDATLKPHTSIAGGELAGSIDNKGLISQVTVQPDAIVIGGKLTSYIVNEGILADFEFVGAKVTGGTLSGKVINNSKVGGYFQDVQLAANTEIIGGAVAGNIQGDCNAPAELKNVTIMPGTHLSCVIISSDNPDEKVTLAEGITFGTGVQFDNIFISNNYSNETSVLPMLGEVIAIDKKGEMLKTDASFSGGILSNDGPFEQSTTFSLSALVDIRGRIIVDSEHEGKLVDVLVVFAHQAIDTNVSTYFMRDTNDDFIVWDVNMVNLEPFQTVESSVTPIEVPIYKGQFDDAGIRHFYFGYRLKDGTVIYSPESLVLNVTK